MALVKQTFHGGAALAYVRHALSQGRSLSRLLLDLDLEKGKIWTYLCSDVSSDYAQARLNETWLVVADNETEAAIVVDGYRIRRKPTFLRPLFVDYIQQFMERSSRAYCLFEDALRKTSDPFVTDRRDAPYAFHGEDIFYVIKHGGATPDAIAEGLRETDSAWVQTVLLTSLPADIADIDPWTEITVQQLSMLVNNVEAFLVSAFDGVGYVVWENDVSTTGEMSPLRG